MDSKLENEAKQYGINASMYNLIPGGDWRRNALLKADIDRAKKLGKEEPEYGNGKQD